MPEQSNTTTALDQQAKKDAPVFWEYETRLGPVKLSFDVVKKYFCAKASDGEVMHFMAICKYHRLNPWLREAYLIKYSDGEPAQIVVGRDTHARRAEEHPQYKGDVGGIIVQTPDGKIIEREGEFFLEPEKLVGGWAKVFRKDREEPVVHRIRLADWDKGRAFWKSTPAHMIAKVARAQARHEAFPIEFDGLISEDEGQAGAGVIEVPIAEPLSVEEAAAKAGTPTPAANPVPDPAPPLFPQSYRTKVYNAVRERAKRENKQPLQVLQELTGREQMPDLTDAEVKALGLLVQIAP